MAAPTRSRNHYYVDGDVTVQVQETLFRLYKFTLCQSSQLFQDMFSRTAAPTIEGTDDDHPIQLHGVESANFEILFDVLWMNYEGPGYWTIDKIGRLLKAAAFCICPGVVNTGLRLLNETFPSDAAQRLYTALMNDVPITRCGVFLHQLVSEPIALIPKEHLWLLGRDFTTVLLEQRSSVQRTRYRASVTPKFCPDPGCDHQGLCKRIWMKLWKRHMKRTLLDNDDPLEGVIELIERTATSQARDCECMSVCMNSHGHTKLANEHLTIKFAVDMLADYFAD